MIDEGSLHGAWYRVGTVFALAVIINVFIMFFTFIFVDMR